MSSPGFTGAGASEFFAGAGRSTTMNNPNAAATNNNHHLLHPSHPLYRTQQQLPALFLDPSSQIAPRQTPTPTAAAATTLIGKRTLAEFQTQQQQQQNHLLNHNHVLSSLLLRSVKPRTATFHNSSPMSPLDFSTSELQSSSSYGFQTQRFGMPLLHQLRPNPINTNNDNNNNNNNNMMGLPITNNNSVLQNSNFPYRSSNLGQAPNRVQVQPPEPEKKIIDHRLQELEKQLLEDEEEEGGADAASVITTSEWSETIQNLMGNDGSIKKPASSSPTSSTTSSTCSSSSSVASPAIGCWKQSLMEAASAISEGKSDAATEILTRLGQVSNPNANADQRLKDCMVSALKSRINPVENPPPVAELFSKEHAESTQLLFENSLCFKVGFTAANLAILEAAFEENNSNRFCIVDFDIGQGKQYLSLLQALSARGRTPLAMVRIAAVAESGGEESLRAVGDMLQRQAAERFRIRFEFKVVVVTQRLAELTRESLGCDPDEPLAVNFAFKLNRIPDESVSTENPRDELLRRVKALTPRVVTVVEQEMNANTAPFLARVAESCSYYGALFDSVESALGRENSERVKVEEALSRKLCNSVACEGRDRVERCEVFGKWRARMGMAGFQLKPLSQSIAESIKSRLAAMGNNNNNRVNSGITVKEENGGICFGWMGKTLTVASAWR